MWVIRDRFAYVANLRYKKKSCHDKYHHIILNAIILLNPELILSVIMKLNQ